MMLNTIYKNLSTRDINKFTENIEAFCASEAVDFSAVYGILGAVSRVLYDKTNVASSQQRAQLLAASAVVLSHFRVPLAAEQTTKFVAVVDYLLWHAADKGHVEELVAYGSHLRRLLPSDPAEGPRCASFKNMHTRTKHAFGKAPDSPQAVQLRVLTLYFLIYSGEDMARIVTELAIVEHLALTNKLPAQRLAEALLELAPPLAAGLQERLVLTAVRLSGVAGDLHLLQQKLQPLWQEMPPCIRLVSCVVDVLSGQSSTLSYAVGALQQLQIPAAQDQLAAEAFFTVYQLLAPLVTTDNPSLKAKVTPQLAELMCGCATTLIGCPRTPVVTSQVVCRACNLVYSLVVAGGPGTVSSRLVCGMLDMLESMPPLRDELAAGSQQWFLMVLETTAGNLGNLARHTGLRAEAIRAFNTTVQFVETQGRHERSSEQLSVHLWENWMRVLSTLLVQEDRHQEALQVLARALLLVQDSKWGKVADAWAGVKAAARKTNRQEDCPSVTIPGLLREMKKLKGALLEQTSLIRALKMEVKSYMTLSDNQPEVDFSGDIFRALCEFAAIPNLASIDRAWMLVMRVRTSAESASFTPQKVHDDLEKAVKLLSAKGKEHVGIIERCLANFYLCLSKKRLEMDAAKEAPLAVGREVPRDVNGAPDEAASCTVVPNHLLLNLAREADTLAPLLETLRLGELLLQQGTFESDGVATHELVGALMQTAQLYTGLGYSLLAGRAWRLVLRVVLKMVETQRTCQKADAIEAAYHLQRLDLWPEEIEMTAVEEILQALNTGNKARYPNMCWSMACAWQNYHKHEIPEALQLANKLLTASFALSRRYENFVLTSDAYHLAALCVGQPFMSKGRNRMELAMLASFRAQCVRGWRAAEQKEKHSPALASVADDVFLLGFLCGTIQYVGAMLVQMHHPRELRQHVKLMLESASSTIVAALRTAQLLSLLTEADLLCEDANDSQVKLNTQRHLLLHAASAPAPRGRSALKPPRSPRSPLSTPARRQLPLPVGTPVARDARWMSQQPRCTSPSLRRPPLAAPPSLRHAADCGCAGCGSVEAQALTVALAAQMARAALLADDAAAAVHGAQMADELCAAREHQMAVAVSTTLQTPLTERQLQNRRQLLWEERCSCRLQLAEIHGLLDQHEAAADANAAALQLLRRIEPDWLQKQFLARHTHLERDIAAQKRQIDKALAGEEKKLQQRNLPVPRAQSKYEELWAADSEDDEDEELAAVEAAASNGARSRPARRPNRLAVPEAEHAYVRTPSPDMLPAEGPASPPKRANRRVLGRMGMSGAKSPVQGVEQESSPSLARTSRRTAAATRRELQQCEQEEAVKATQRTKSQTKAAAVEAAGAPKSRAKAGRAQAAGKTNVKAAVEEVPARTTRSRVRKAQR